MSNLKLGCIHLKNVRYHKASVANFRGSTCHIYWFHVIQGFCVSSEIKESMIATKILFTEAPKIKVFAINSHKALKRYFIAQYNSKIMLIVLDYLFDCHVVDNQINFVTRCRSNENLLAPLWNKITVIQYEFPQLDILAKCVICCPKDIVVVWKNMYKNHFMWEIKK